MPQHFRFALMFSLLAANGFAQGTVSPEGVFRPGAVPKTVPLAPVAAEAAAAAPASVKPRVATNGPINADDYAILKVNGDPIYRSKVEQIWQNLVPGESAPPFESLSEPMKMNILRGVASEQLIYREAKASGVADSPEVLQRVALLKEKVAMQVFLDRKTAALVTDAEVRKAYDQKVAELRGKEEVKARHILVDTEDKAEEIEKDLKDGESFAELAKKLSLDKSNSAKGGELGWFGEGEMVPEFSKAAMKLKKGEFSPPVKTSFGWHVIELEDRRPVKAPDYEKAKASLREQLQAKELKTYLGQLIDSSSIDYFDKTGEKLEFTKTPDTTVE